MLGERRSRGFEFQSTPPGWEATARPDHRSAGRDHFNPRLPGGRRRSALIVPASMRHFNPRLPGGRRQVGDYPSHRLLVFQSTPPGWEATLESQRYARLTTISIHASRVGGDMRCPYTLQVHPISIHASRVGGDWMRCRRAPARRIFQSTPPGWEATIKVPDQDKKSCYFNPRLPGGRRLQKSIKNGRILWNFC